MQICLGFDTKMIMLYRFHETALPFWDLAIRSMVQVPLLWEPHSRSDAPNRSTRWWKQHATPFQPMHLGRRPPQLLRDKKPTPSPGRAWRGTFDTLPGPLPLAAAAPPSPCDARLAGDSRRASPHRLPGRHRADRPRRLVAWSQAPRQDRRRGVGRPRHGSPGSGGFGRALRDGAFRDTHRFGRTFRAFRDTRRNVPYRAGVRSPFRRPPFQPEMHSPSGDANTPNPVRPS